MEYTSPFPQRTEQPDFLDPLRQLGSRASLDLLFAWNALRVVGRAELLADRAFMEIYKRVFPYTLTSIENVHTLYRATRYVAAQGIEGDFVECGVWRGGSSMTMALALLANGDSDRAIHLYDTFSGMTRPSREDGVSSGIWWLDVLDAPLEVVQENMRSTGLDPEKIVFVEGPVEETLPKARPEKIALLRLDTDFYESTYCELLHLYPRLSPGGVLIIDDYAFFSGCRTAVDQYFREHDVRMLLHRTDYAARIGVKPFAPP